MVTTFERLAKVLKGYIKPANWIERAFAGIASSSDIPQPSTTIPENLGAASVGTSLKYARADHVHDLKSAVNWITPEMYGATGDGTTDDTAALRAAVKAAVSAGKKLLLCKTYYITESLLTSEDYNSTVTVDIEGTSPLKNYIYAIDSYGGIKFANGVNVFDGISIRGSIYRVAFMPVSRTQTGSIFKSCTLTALRFDSCSVSNILAFCHNTDVESVTQITNSRFMSVYYFGKCDTIRHSFNDSFITGNYIDGGAEMTTNNCFEWAVWSGSTVSGNFIDFYRSIFHPFSESNLAFQGPISTGNQYQAFRYLYDEGEHITKGEFNSVSDCFNWTDPTKLTKLAEYTPIQYKDPYNVMHDLPPYIACAYQTWNVKIVNAIIQANVANAIFIRHAFTNYQYGALKVSIAGGANMYQYDTFVSGADLYWMSGDYKLNNIDIPFVKQLESVPTDSNAWNAYYLGQKILVENHVYKRVYKYDTTNIAWVLDWEDISALV